ncbi:hypothetical protein K438DRAFT_2027948 [Mycena galopus ATCC 62051]|nr:hypothetical protein K438DRAFT_2027948 [Mycena galopus ATCC 62051]
MSDLSDRVAAETMYIIFGSLFNRIGRRPLQDTFDCLFQPIIASVNAAYVAYNEKSAISAPDTGATHGPTPTFENVAKDPARQGLKVAPAPKAGFNRSAGPCTFATLCKAASLSTNAQLVLDHILRPSPDAISADCIPLDSAFKASTYLGVQSPNMTMNNTHYSA